MIAHATYARRAPLLGLNRATAAIALGVGLIPFLAANGGYFPTTWGWTTVLFAWAAALAAVFGDAQRVSKLEWVFLGGLSATAIWSAASGLWSIAPTASVLETERTLAFVAFAFAATAVVRRQDAFRLSGSAAFGAAAIAVYSLATRLFPDRFHVHDAVAAYRLSTPIGYWNSLGLVAAIAALLAAGLIANSELRLVRFVCSAAVPLLLTTLYFTYSRGAWIALFAGLAVLLAAEPSRVRMVLRLALPSVGAATAVLLASARRALTDVAASTASAAHAGHRLAPLLLLVSLGVGVGTVLVDRAPFVSRDHIPLPRAAAIAVAVLLLAALVAGFAQYGGPQTLARHAYDSFVAPSPDVGSNLNSRLFNLSGSGRWIQWKAAIHAFEGEPVVGVGAGGYERYWLEHRPVPGKVRDAHSLYLEFLGEMGVVGLSLLALVFIAPAFAVRRVRRLGFVPGALAAFVAYLVHAAVDWDWELTGVTLLALACAVSILIAARGEDARVSRWAILAPATVVGVLGFVGLAGNIALAQSASAARAGNWRSAASHARRAHTFAPWSSQPWQDLGEAQLGAGDTQAAVVSFHKALGKSPGDWSVWFDMARATTGAAQRAALDHAARLNPLSPEVAELRREIAAEKVIQVGQE